MSKALFVIDVQNDFTEGGALGVTGGDAVATGVTRLLDRDSAAYDFVFASRDWHDEPIAELRRIWGLYAPQQAAYMARARAPSVAPSF